MPPKPKYTRELLINVSREIIAEHGMEALSAREISGRLGSTTAPIFTIFGSMEELVKAVFFSIAEECQAYLLDSLEYSPSLKEFGVRWVKYARENPRFYELVFLLRGQTESLALLTKKKLSELLVPLAESTAKTFSISIEDANSVIDRLILFVSGICVSTVNNVRFYTDEQVSELVGEFSTAFLNQIYNYKCLDSVERTQHLFKSK